MQQPEPEEMQVERVVEPTDIKPDSFDGSGLFLLAPWEILLISKAKDDHYGVHWACPRCLDVGSLAGHFVEVAGYGFFASADQGMALQLEPDLLQELKDTDPEELEVTANPSIGCQCCGFHCYLEQSEYRVLNDWLDGIQSSRDPDNVFTNRIQKLHEHRPDVYERVAELVEGDQR